MPVNKYALLRYRIIHRCLRNRYRPYPDKEFLRRQCEESLFGATDGSRLSAKTIERDLRDMREDAVLGFYAPIVYSKEHQGYHYSDPEYDIDHKPLSEEESDALAFAANTLFQFRDSGIFQQYSFAIEKIFEHWQLQHEPDPTEQSLVRFESVPYMRGSTHLKPIYQAMRQRFRIGFVYQKFSGEESSHRILDPYLLKEYRNRWYVIGYELKNKKIQSFGLDRILELEVLAEMFERDPGFDPDHYFQHAMGITEGGLTPERVVLSFSPFQGKYLKSQPLHHSQEVLKDNKQEFRIAITVLVSFELYQIILGYGPEVRVMEPETLKNDVARKLKLASAQYKAVK
ncbi:MAG: WYL domain-containing protein [Bacteroidales bacterium]